MDKKVDRETLELLQEHLTYLKRKFNPKLVLLFGSRARGEHLKDSDIDLLIVSPKFEGMNWRERIIETMGNWDKRQLLEPLCYTPVEFEQRKKQSSIVREAVAHRHCPLSPGRPWSS